ncbi:MAG TPA: hypothetical protein VMU58_14600 [Gaiellaceae bacterium]|nr:hypothetical protein [Gaiellaceae bacterium]
MRRTLLAALGAALATAAPAGAALPVYSGSSIGEGLPLKVYATVTPTVHLFGDAVTARLAVVADTKLVDPSRLRVQTGFTPYRSVRSPVVGRVAIGRFTQVTWTWTLRCMTTPCVPEVPPSDRYRVFRFQTIHITYLSKNGQSAYGIDATWPKVEVLSQVSPGVMAFLEKTNHLNWRFDLAPVAAPAYRVSPRLVYRLALAAALLLFLAAAALAWRWFRTVRPARVPTAGPDTGTTLERALALLAWAHARGDETLERKALERVAGELPLDDPRPKVDELSRTARELAWSQRTPEDEEVATLSERARETSRAPEPEETAE